MDKTNTAIECTLCKGRGSVSVGRHHRKPCAACTGRGSVPAEAAHRALLAVAREVELKADGLYRAGSFVAANGLYDYASDIRDRVAGRIKP